MNDITSDYELLDKILPTLDTLKSYDKNDIVMLKDIAKDYLTPEEYLLFKEFMELYGRGLK